MALAAWLSGPTGVVGADEGRGTSSNTMVLLGERR
jgi:hypothetical protein